MKPVTPLPLFSEGSEYRQLHPTKEGRRRWRFVTLRPVRLRVDGITSTPIHYHDAHGKVWARHDRFGLLVEPGYSWNGCTPKRWVWPFGWIGTPDFPATILASLCHDVGYQFARTAHFPLTRHQVDGLFFHTIAMAGDEELARIYHAAVRQFGSWGSRPKNGEYSTLP
jgi:hypothetical protein